MNAKIQHFVLALSVLLILPTTTYSQGMSSNADAVSKALHSWHTKKAREVLEPMLRRAPEDPIGIFLEARLLYLEGRYAESIARFNKLPQEILETPGAAQLYAQVKKTEETLRPFSEYRTENGRFLVRYLGKDKLLLPYLLEVLVKAEKALSADFNYVPSSPILVEVYPTIEYLAAVSSLTKKDLETSGTIALCSDNKLMLTSPRGLARGYGWRDTIAHEFVHYYVTKVSDNTVPIWLHEGIAKFQETRWRDKPGHELDPPQEDLLARSLKTKQLITYEQMHPSMALLPSQEAAALAFAEVHSTIRYLHQRGGYKKMRNLLKQLGRGKNMDTALTQTYGFTLNGLWNKWLKWAQSLGLKTYPGLVHIPLSFKRPGQDDEDIEAELITIKEKRVKDLTHLGELLRARERPLAALKEYMKAMSIQGKGNAVIQNGAASALLSLNRPEEVPELMTLALKYQPTYLLTHLNLGRAFERLKNWQAARQAYEAMIGINPFHPEVHEALLRIYGELGMNEEANRAKNAMEIIKE